ncbi:MAG: TadE/TadG family type IV pilus assembly protein [Acidimicrobiales bacterium]
MRRHSRTPGDDPVRSGGDAGQATVELVLTLPVVVLLVLGLLQVALVATERIQVAHAVREAARAAAVDPTPAVAAAAARGATGLDPNRMEVTTSGGSAPGDLLTVVVAYWSVTDLPLIGPLVGDVALESRATIRVE